MDRRRFLRTGLIAGVSGAALGMARQLPGQTRPSVGSGREDRVYGTSPSQISGHDDDMIAQLRRSDFTSRLSESFLFRSDGIGPVGVTLTEVADVQTSSAKRKTPADAVSTSPDENSFSLFFQGPPTPFLQQDIYRISHESIGSFKVLVVPMGMNSKGYVYQVLFNRPNPK